MKFDKETLIKQRFWVLLVAFLPLVLFCILFLWTYVDSGISDKQRAIDLKKQELKDTQGKTLKGDDDLRKLDERSAALEAYKLEIWKAAWEAQNKVVGNEKPLFSWPTSELETVLTPLSFADPIPDTARAAYHTPQVYKPQMDQLGATFTTKLPFGLQATDQEFQSTLFRDGWKERLRYVKNFYDAKIVSSPSSEEVWLAQEDYWVQRELLQAIQKTNEEVGKLPPVKDLEIQGKEIRGVFRNANWQLELTIAEKSGSKDANYLLRGKLKNVSSRRMLAGKHYFTIAFKRDTPPVVLLVDADALGVDQEWPIADYPIFLGVGLATKDLKADPRDPKADAEAEKKGTKIDGLRVDQLFDSKEAPSRPPVRRIDRLELGYSSHRTIDHLKADPKFATGNEARPGGGRRGPGAGPGPAPAPGPGPTPGPGPGPGPGGPPTAAAGEQRTENGLIRERYSDITGQVRRMPIGMVLIVDQANVPDLLSSLANSRLRFQVTQVDWHHTRGLGRSTTPGPGDRRPMPGDPVGPPTSGNPETRPTPEANDENLVEVTVYGIASLFERFQPAKPAGTAVK